MTFRMTGAERPAVNPNYDTVIVYAAQGRKAKIQPYHYTLDGERSLCHRWLMSRALHPTAAFSATKWDRPRLDSRSNAQMEGRSLCVRCDEIQMELRPPETQVEPGPVRSVTARAIAAANHLRRRDRLAKYLR